jgi:hypothetical protein
VDGFRRLLRRRTEPARGSCTGSYTSKNPMAAVTILFCSNSPSLLINLDKEGFSARNGHLWLGREHSILTKNKRLQR